MKKEFVEAKIELLTKLYVGKTILEIGYDEELEDFYLILSDGNKVML